MRTIRVETSKLPPHIAAHVGAKEVEIHLTDRITIGSQQWSEGSRDVYHVASLDHPVIHRVEDFRPWPQNMGALGESEIMPRHVIIKTGTFCGKTATPFVYARESDVSPVLPKPVPELSHEQKQVLYCLGAFNSSGRKRYRDDFRMSKDRWDEVVQSLAALGLATSRGSATVEGKNISRTIDSMIVNPYSELSKAR